MSNERRIAQVILQELFNRRLRFVFLDIRFGKANHQFAHCNISRRRKDPPVRPFLKKAAGAIKMMYAPLHAVVCARDDARKRPRIQRISLMKQATDESQADAALLCVAEISETKFCPIASEFRRKRANDTQLYKAEALLVQSSFRLHLLRKSSIGFFHSSVKTHCGTGTDSVKPVMADRMS